MSQPDNAKNMEESSRMAGLARRAREQAQAGGSRRSPLSAPDPSVTTRRPQAPAGLQTKDGMVGIAISRPTQIPQWPLAGPVAPPVSLDNGTYRPPPGRSQPPQRPPRPSRVPSILDSSRVQDPTPTFQYTSQSAGNSDYSAPETPVTQSSRPSTFSSVGSIPDFPLPVATPGIPPRRSVTLGPPPSARRGASSFYSTTSFVSPIPEESPRIRSHVSYASSAAIPESFGTLSPASPFDPYFDDAIVEESMISDDGDDSRLVRSASIGKRGKPSLITTKATDRTTLVQRPQPKPVQGSPFVSGTGYVEGSSSSGNQSAVTMAGNPVLTTDTMLNAFESAGATDPSTVPRVVPQLRPSRLSGLRRPPRLDIDAVRDAEARGSLTSLPDLIRRATRLATMMDRGKRPASRLDDLDFPDDIYGGDPEKNDNIELDRHQSGLSDMLAAFPPPGSRRSMRRSIASWPLARRASRAIIKPEAPRQPDDPTQPRKQRRCCGLPLWGFLVILFILIVAIVAAIVVPIEVRANKQSKANQESSCMQQLPCANGGTSVVSQGQCSCICSNGFTGKDCTIPATQGCTTTTLETSDAMKISNVTIGQAIPRLVLEAQTNFSVALSATSILSKFSSAGLSCNAQNALVTFDGRSLRNQGGQGQNFGLGSEGFPALAAVVGDEITLTLLPGVDATITLGGPFGPGDVFTTTLIIDNPRVTSIKTSIKGYPTIDPPSTSTPSSTTSSPTTRQTSTPSVTPSKTTQTSQTTMTTMTTRTPQPTGEFTISDAVVDFARIAVLFVLQETSVDEASAAQNALQKFFNSAGSQPMVDQARNITIGNGNSVNLVDLFIDVGAGKVGGSDDSK